MANYITLPDALMPLEVIGASFRDNLDFNLAISRQLIFLVFFSHLIISYTT